MDYLMLILAIISIIVLSGCVIKMKKDERFL